MAIAAALLSSSPLPLVATATRSYVVGSRSGAGSVITDSTTIILTGGDGTPSYSWAYLSGDAGFTATASTSATTAFTTTVSFGDIKLAVWRCTITMGSDVRTVDVELAANELTMDYR